MSDIVTIVVVGASYAGVEFVRNIEPALKKAKDKRVRIIVIDKNEYYYHRIASLRAATIPGWEDKIFGLREKIFSATENRYMLNETEVTNFDQKEKTVTISPPHIEFGATIKFDYAILATGAASEGPTFPISTKVDEQKQELRRYQHDIKEAKNILIIGGGTVAIEWAGEVRNEYPDTKITLSTSTDSLLSRMPSSIKSKALDMVNSSGVKVILNERINLPPNTKTGPFRGSIKVGSETLTPDYVYLAIGFKPSTAFLPKEILDKIGYVKVNKKLQLPDQPNVFAIGDTNNSGEEKAIPAVYAHAAYVATNLAKHIISGFEFPDYAGSGVAVLLTYGPQNGLVMLPFLHWYVFGGFLAKLIKSATLGTSGMLDFKNKFS